MAIGIQISPDRSREAERPGVPTLRPIIDWEAGWRVLQHQSAPQIVPPSTELFRQGDRPSGVYLIEKGMVKRMRLEEEGQQMIVGLRRSGDLLGVVPVALGKPATVVTESLTQCRLRFVDAQRFRRLADSVPSVVAYVNHMLSRRLYGNDARLAGFGVLTARKRLEQFLAQLASEVHPEQEGGELRLQLPLKQWEIAQLIAVTESYVCRLFKEMCREGLLRRDKGWLILTDRKRLG